MKKYYIKVNGKQYDVETEEISGFEIVATETVDDRPKDAMLESDAVPSANGKYELWIFQLIAVVMMIALDQWFKRWTVSNIGLHEIRNLMPGIIHLTYVKNTGASLGMLAGMRGILLAISAAFVAVGVWAVITKRLKHSLGTWALAFVIAGAAGNAIDRALYGYVVDMFEFEIVFDFFIFNIADVFITLGGIALCLYVLIFELKKTPENETGRNQWNR